MILFMKFQVNFFLNTMNIHYFYYSIAKVNTLKNLIFFPRIFKNLKLIIIITITTTIIIAIIIAITNTIPNPMVMVQIFYESN